MSRAVIINGNEISQKVKDSLKPRVKRLREKGVTPGLAAILIGDDPASAVYVNRKSEAFASTGLFSQTYKLPADTEEKYVLSLIDEINNDNKFHGILVQLPLPSHLNEQRILQRIDPDKDADGLHPQNIGKMMLGMNGPLPCTPHGILMLLKYSGINPDGLHTVILGRSNIVGKPLANLLMQKREVGNSTVTVCHTHTRNLKDITRQADILICAMGRPEFVDSSFVKMGAVVIDVGVNRVDDPKTKGGYRLVGDVKFDEVAEVAKAITPVPGGVGPMTIAMLIENTVYLAEKHLREEGK